MIAEQAVIVSNNHCFNAEEFLASAAVSSEYKEAQRRMARLSIALQVLDEIGSQATKRSDSGKAAFEVMSAIKPQ